jgi:uncharacterized protein
MQNVRVTYDGIASVMTGAGTSADRRMSYKWYTQSYSAEEVINSYRESWIMRRCIDLPARDMMKAGREWQIDDNGASVKFDAVDAIEAVENEFKVNAKICEGLVLGMLLGGALIIGDGNSADQELGEIPKGGLKYLHLMPRQHVNIGPIIRDITNPLYGEPEYFWVSGSTTGTQRIHPSRVIPFKGLPIPDDRLRGDEQHYWGDPLFVSLRDCVNNATNTLNSLAGLVDKSVIDILKIDGMTSIIGADDQAQEDALSRKIGFMTTAWSNLRAVAIDKDDEIDRLTVAFTGMPEMMMAVLAIVAAARGIPATKFMSKAPDGMNATGDGDADNYEGFIAEMQETILRPIYERLDPVLFGHAGIPYEGVWYEFKPLSDRGNVKRLDAGNKLVDMITKVMNSGTVPADVMNRIVPTMLENEGLMPGLGQAMTEMGGLEQILAEMQQKEEEETEAEFERTMALKGANAV